ncbi:hypothetical protein U9M48_041309 [Paspalum notatum var. saurae]|uniref:Uncharacterized protein n=1 Tax=Paspalum notatum var. saurae TaxID=547442 RepID=A0AAQ3XE24_PASNO
MKTKMDKAQKHNVVIMATREQRFEVACKDTSRRGVRRERTVQECLIGNNGIIHCSCFKPQLLHLPCSHVLAACREVSVDPTTFVSAYYKKETIAATWKQELYGYGMVRTYTELNVPKWYILDTSMKIAHKGRHQTRHIRNGMDEAEAEKRPKQCTQCGAVGHNYKKCPQNAVPGAAEARPSGNATDGAPPSFEMTSSSRMAGGLPTSELLDADIDSGHRSYLSVVEHKRLRTFQCRPPAEYLCLDNRWVGRLHGAGLLTLARLVEGGPVGRHGRDRPRLVIDPSLITALIDRWRPETYTFHRVHWRRTPIHCLTYLVFVIYHYLSTSGLLTYHIFHFSYRQLTSIQTQTMTASAGPLRPISLWLFGFIMFKNGHGNTVDKVLMPYAQEIADAYEDQVPTWSWGSAVLAATYRGLCDACIKDDDRAKFQGCALLLQLWSYERLAVGRPIVDHGPYELPYYGELEDDRPTMGTLWVCPRELPSFQRHLRTWANEQARRTYPNFVAELDRLKADDVIWEPYSPLAVATRAPYELSSWCTSNSGLWRTKSCLVYDIYVEAHRPDRVMRQFGYQQPFPHRVHLTGFHGATTDFKSKVFHKCYRTRHIPMRKLKPYVDAWDDADEDVFEPIGDHTNEWYQYFPTWYQARTRIQTTYAETRQVAHEAMSTDAYARHRDEALAGANTLLATVTCPLGIDAGTGRQSFLHDRAVGGVDQGKRRHGGISSHGSCTRPTATSSSTANSTPRPDPSMEAPSTSYMPMGHPPPISSPHMGTPSLQPMGPPAFTPIHPQATGFNMSTGADPSHTQSIYMGTNINDNEAFSFSGIDSDGGGDRHDVLGASQLDGAPRFATQEATHTPLVQQRPERVARSPDHHTYSTDHVHAQQRARQQRRRRGG